jgi:hypothetical protein
VTGNKPRVFEFVLALLMFSIVCAMFTFYYQASFTRYQADDYCASVIFDSPNVPRELVDRFVNKTGRYSNILYIGVVDIFELAGIRFAPAFMLTIWFFTLTWLGSEIRRPLRLDGLPVIMDYILAGLLIMISVYSAPNRFQTFYWRSGAATHFIPLVFLSFLLAYLLWRNRRAGSTPPTVLTFLFVFLLALFTAGFSEPPTTAMITSGIISIALLMRHGGFAKHRSMISLLACALAGSVAGLLMMFFAPGTAFRLGGSSPLSIDVLILRILRSPSEFLIDTLRVAPVPTLYLLFTSVVVFFCVFHYYKFYKPRPVVIISLVVIVLSAMYVLIAASFAPSIYGQSYPAPRARFIGYLFFNIAVLLTGGFIGIWLANVDWFTWGVPVGLGLLVLLSIYPLRIASSVINETLDNRALALAWDQRDSEIRSLKSQGMLDLSVSEIPQVSDVGELKPKPNYINNCAARFYGVNSIVAVSGKTK